MRFPFRLIKSGVCGSKTQESGRQDSEYLGENAMGYVLAFQSRSETTYYAGSKRQGIERVVERTTHLPDHATIFDTTEEAQDLLKELSTPYKVVEDSL